MKTMQHFFKKNLYTRISFILLFAVLFQGCTSFYPKYEGDPILHNHEVEQYEKPYYQKGINTFGWTLNLGISAGVGYAAYQYAPTTPLIDLSAEAGMSLTDNDARLIQGLGSGIIMGLVNYAIMKDNTRKEIVTDFEAKQWITDYDNSRKLVEFSKGRFLSTIPKDGDKRFAMENIKDARFFAEQYPNSMYADAVVTKSLSSIPVSNRAELVNIFPNLDISAKIKLELIMSSKTLEEWLTHTREYPDIIAKADKELMKDKISQLCMNLQMYSRFVKSNPSYIDIRILETMAIEYVKSREDIITFRNIFPNSLQEKKLEKIALGTINDFSSGLKVKEMFAIQSEHPLLDSIVFNFIRSLSEVKIFQNEFSYSSYITRLPEYSLQYVHTINHMLEYIGLFPGNLLIDRIIQEKELSYTRTEIITILQKITYSQRLTSLKRRLVDLSITFDDCIETAGITPEFLEELAKKCVGFLKSPSDYRKFMRIFSNTEEGKTQQLHYYEIICKEPENLGPSINSAFSDSYPIISPDGESLYFMRYEHPTGFGGHDIYFSKLDTYGEWSPAINIGPPLNNRSPNAVYSISQDGQELFLHNQYTERGSNPSITQFDNGAWTEPKTQYIPELQSQGNYHNGSLSVDGKYLLMSIGRGDAMGGNDLYVILKDEYGNWKVPLNLGPTINTHAEESSVFIAADGQTIYFSSSGHSGYGGKDMFVSHRLDDTWQNWTTPLNLGNTINSNGDDEFYVIPAKGDFIYFSSNRSGFGDSDVFRTCLPFELRPKPVTLLTGRVYNRKDNKAVSATVYYEDLETGKVLGSVKTNAQTGEYKIILVVGKKYGYYAIADKLLPQSENLDLVNLIEYKKEIQDLTMVPIESGQSITMNNLFFESKQFALKLESFPELDRIVKTLEQNPTVKIEIGGHTDDVGSDENNLNLSEKRAFEVYMYFISKNISKERLTYVGYGETKPKVPNTNDQNRAMNRRVELMIK
jgi:OmpA-OmpF porin, OOP family